MRVRFFEVNSGAIGNTLRCDEFPALLEVDQSGQLQTSRGGGNPLCRLDDAGGQILFESLVSERTLLVNNAPLAWGPLRPGDQLSVDGHKYVVSYEQIANPPDCETRFHLMTS